MERIVPSTVSEEIELYVRTIYSLLRSTTDVQIRTLEEAHAGMDSLLHGAVREPRVDVSAFIYSLLRLPPYIDRTRLVVLGQSATVFEEHGYKGITGWEQVSARARRRRCYFDGNSTLACLIASQSDIDDIIPTLTAFQIEWNKLHNQLQPVHADWLTPHFLEKPSNLNRLADALQISPDSLNRLRVIWGEEFPAALSAIAHHRADYRVRLLGGSLSEYWRATSAWWDNIEKVCANLSSRPVYFVSSNPHSLPNLLTGFALQNEDKILEYLQTKGDNSLLEEWNDIQSGRVPASRENYLYYALKKYQQSPAGEGSAEAQIERERALGIERVSSEHSFDLEAQVIDLNRLDPETLDPRLQNGDLSFLKKTNALIINIDYPLGLAAYNVLSKVAEHVYPVLGIYVMGKAAILNGVRGDVMIPNVVFDEHSRNTYLFKNAFSAADVSPYLAFGSVLDNQKAVTVLGTFLQNARIMDVIYREGFTDIEMESGPYLSAIYEMYRPERHPYDEIVNLYGLPFEVGILHYASDKPLSKGLNLGAGALSYFGMDSTYATSVAILRRILQNERERLKNT